MHRCTPQSRSILPAALVALLAGSPVGLAQTAGPDDLRDPMSRASAFNEGVSVDENLVVDLHVNDEDLTSILEMLSIQSQRSIVASQNVNATVTANLYSVTFYEALDAILHVNGYGYIEEGNFIYVYTLEELQEIMEQNRRRAYKVIRLDYLNAIDAAEFVEPLLSEGGQIKTNGAVGDFPEASLPIGAEEFANGATMVVVDYPEIIEEIELLLEELDTRPAQVLIEATILQTALTEENAFGIDFSIIGSLDFIDFAGGSGPLGVVDGLISGQSQGLDASGGATIVPQPTGGEGHAVQANPGNTAGPATFKAGIVNGDIAAFIRLLDQVSDTTILSQPNILTLNRMPARVLVGEKVGYLNTTSTDTATTQTVEFLDTGTQLYVRPFVSSEGLIRMELKPQVSEASIRNATDATGAAVTIPDELTNELVTNVMVRDGQTIVLGGLYKDNTVLTRRQVPIVGDLPIIGAAFRGHEDSISRSEIIFMVKPSIVSDDILIAQGDRAVGLVERVVAGAREGLLPWSRSKRSAQLLIRATNQVEAGKYNRALHNVQKALTLDHSNGQAIAIRDTILNETTADAQHLLDEIIMGELETLLDTVPAPDDRDRFGNRPKAPKPEPQPTRVSEADAPNSQTTSPDVQTANAQPAEAEIDPIEDTLTEAVHAALTAPEDTQDYDDAPTRSEIAASVRESGSPSPDVADADAQPGAEHDWLTLQNALVAEVQQNTQPQPVSAPIGEAAPSGYRYAESQEAISDLLGQIGGEPGAEATYAQSTVTFSTPSIELHDLFATLMQMTGRTIVHTPHVQGTVSVDLQNASFENAISTIAADAGLATLEHGGVTYFFQPNTLDPTDERPAHWIWKSVELDNVDAGAVLPEARAIMSAQGQAETNQSIPHDAPFTPAQFDGDAIVMFDLLPNAEQAVWILNDIDARAASSRTIADVPTP